MNVNDVQFVSVARDARCGWTGVGTLLGLDPKSRMPTQLHRGPRPDSMTPPLLGSASAAATDAKVRSLGSHKPRSFDQGRANRVGA